MQDFLVSGIAFVFFILLFFISHPWPFCSPFWIVIPEGLNQNITKIRKEAREMAWWLRELAALSQDPSSILSSMSRVSQLSVTTAPGDPTPLLVFSGVCACLFVCKSQSCFRVSLLSILFTEGHSLKPNMLIQPLHLVPEMT